MTPPRPPPPSGDEPPTYFGPGPPPNPRWGPTWFPRGGPVLFQWELLRGSPWGPVISGLNPVFIKLRISGGGRRWNAYFGEQAALVGYVFPGGAQLGVGAKRISGKKPMYFSPWDA